MTIRVLSSREFNQDSGKAKQAANEGPVFITDRGRPSHVLLSIEDYERLTGSAGSIVDALAMPADQHVEFEAPRMDLDIRPADLS
ncbi:type II toxin-antitoxin system Phd/YefM family antitoxin [Azohydromonas aeria]|uniref:type II toxin-antitoxin system Phd/YefM family antitoxin n=1 Tax=Azohydromonas aeria TaxID=2590212 RepID=UPI0012FA00AD|nr:type II toxin-antitoxin system Phd/YefM family antitoxin [Azohydromonas aeria]